MNLAKSPTRWSTFAAPSRYFDLSGRLIPWFWAVALVLAVAGLYIGFFVAPTDHQQGESYRIIFIHVPAAWMSMLIYLVMAFWAAWGWMLNARMASMYARALAPTGAMFTFVALWTGALWGKPTWGTWWVWDARLTSEFILLLLYIGYIALTEAIDDARRAAHAGALLALVGAVNIPIIYFSVRWWNTLHQGATIKLTAAPAMVDTMLTAMLLMTFSFWAYSFAVVFTRARAIVLEQESDTEWVRALVNNRRETTS
ncbi:heme ABC transporter permease CcmC [Ideonella sp. A 288]|uniref:heme ABC transporter permease CcmC n=1 Tax=Ideonella sp. A 288 TaxID=1962181 RepID=UPI000B4C1405|nr:heme ABC transporter permease CcmC [Ideonella sp. A 288]